MFYSIMREPMLARAAFFFMHAFHIFNTPATSICTIYTFCTPK